MAAQPYPRDIKIHFPVFKIHKGDEQRTFIHCKTIDFFHLTCYNPMWLLNIFT